MPITIQHFADLDRDQKIVLLSQTIERGIDDAQLIAVAQELDADVLTAGIFKSMIYKGHFRAVEHLLGKVEDTLTPNQAFSICETAIAHQSDGLVQRLLDRALIGQTTEDRQSLVNALSFTALASRNELAATLLMAAGAELTKHLENGVQLSPLNIFHEVSTGRQRNRIIAAAMVRNGRIPGHDLAVEVKTREQAAWLYERHPDKQAVLSGLKAEFRDKVFDQSIQQP